MDNLQSTVAPNQNLTHQPTSQLVLRLSATLLYFLFIDFFNLKLRMFLYSFDVLYRRGVHFKYPKNRAGKPLLPLIHLLHFSCQSFVVVQFPLSKVCFSFLYLYSSSLLWSCTTLRFYLKYLRVWEAFQLFFYEGVGTLLKHAEFNLSINGCFCDQWYLLFTTVVQLIDWFDTVL